MEFESTEKREPPRSYVVVVYDPRDGRIVHGHEFVGRTGLFSPDGREERERETLEGARRNHGDVSRLAVLHVPAEFRPAPGSVYRVDAKVGRLVAHVTSRQPGSRPKKVPSKKVARRKKR